MFAQKRIDDAVSPVVGVILMVAVTVILAAVIGSFVLDLGNNVQANPQAGVSFDQAPSNNGGDIAVSVQVVSMENADEIRLSNSANSDTATLNSVGASYTFDHDGTNDYSLSSGDKVTVVGVLDGKEAVLQTYTVQ